MMQYALFQQKDNVSLDQETQKDRMIWITQDVLSKKSITKTCLFKYTEKFTTMKIKIFR